MDLLEFMEKIDGRTDLYGQAVINNVHETFLIGYRPLGTRATIDRRSIEVATWDQIVFYLLEMASMKDFMYYGITPWDEMKKRVKQHKETANEQDED